MWRDSKLPLGSFLKWFFLGFLRDFGVQASVGKLFEVVFLRFFTGFWFGCGL